MNFLYSSLQFKSQHSETALFFYKGSLLKGQVWNSSQTSCGIGSVSKICCFGKTGGHKDSYIEVLKRLAYWFIPSVLVLELETSRNITAVVICQDTTGKGVTNGASLLSCQKQPWWQATTERIAWLFYSLLWQRDQCHLSIWRISQAQNPHENQRLRRIFIRKWSCVAVILGDKTSRRDKTWHSVQNWSEMVV